MTLEKNLSELQTMIDKFLAIHSNPYDTSKHNETASKLENLKTVLSTNAKKISSLAMTNNENSGMGGDQIEKKQMMGSQMGDDQMGEFMEMPDFDNDLDGKPTPEEIMKFITEKSEKIIKNLGSIKDLQELEKLETDLYDDLKAYYDAYYSILDEKDQQYYKSKVEKCKKAIDNLKLELETNPDDNDAFISEIETGIETINGNIPNATTIADGEALLDEYNTLNDKFIAHTENAKTLSPAWIKEIKSKLDRLRQNIAERQVELSENVSELSNRCETLIWAWTIREHKRDVTTKEDRIKRAIKKIEETLKVSYKIDPEDIDDKEDIKGREKRLIKKLEKLKIKEAVLAEDETTVTDTEKLEVKVVFCEKLRTPTGSDKGKVPYWGISEIILPADRQTNNDAGLSIQATSTIEENGFSDTATVNFTFVREQARQFSINWQNLFGAIANTVLNTVTPTNPINWGQVISDLLNAASGIVEENQVVAKNSELALTIAISTDPDNLSNVTLELQPESDHKALDELSYKKIETFGTWVTYEGDLESANTKFMTAAKKQLNLK